MTEENKVILHGMWASPYVKRVELALKFKGIPYEYVEEDLTNRSDLLLKYNPVHRMVPVLVHNGKPIAESAVILEYIDETWKQDPRLLPDDPYKRAQVRFWVKFLQEQAIKLFETMLAVLKTEGEVQEKAIEEISEKMNVLENGMKDFFLNAEPSVDNNDVGLLDIVFCSSFGGYKFHEKVLGITIIDPDDFPLLFSWVTAFIDLPAVKGLTPPAEKVVNLLQFIRQNAVKSTAA